MTYVLCGFQSAGKSTFGRHIAEKLGLCFADSDRLIEGRVRASTGEPISCKDIYRKYGSLAFRHLEEQVILSLPLGEIDLLSLGGGSLMSGPCRKKLQEHAKIVYLQMDFKTLESRLEGKPIYLQEAPSLEEFYQLRHAIFTHVADITLDITKFSPEAIEEYLTRLLSQEAYARK